MGTKNNPGEFDCYANADPDEPMFVLLGRDKHAPTLVWLWSTLRELDGEDQAKVTEARACAVAMTAWAHAKGRPVVGFGQATLAGVMELIRSVNGAAKLLEKNKEQKNQATDMEIMRLFLAETTFEGSSDAAVEKTANALGLSQKDDR
jgi:hypothetical protein